MRDNDLFKGPRASWDLHLSNVSAQEMVAGRLIGIERLVHFLGLTKAVKSVKYRDFSFTKHIFNTR